MSYNSINYNIDSCFVNVDIFMYSSFSYVKSGDTKSTIFINHSKNTANIKGRHQIIFQYSGKLFDFDDFSQGVGKVQLNPYNWYIFKISLQEYLNNVVPYIFSPDPETPGMVYIDIERYIAIRKEQDKQKGFSVQDLKSDEEYSNELVFEFMSQGAFETILTITPIITEKEHINEEFENPETVSGYPGFAMFINHDSKCGKTDLYGFRSFCEKIKELNFDTIASNNTLMAMTKQSSYKKGNSSQPAPQPTKASIKRNITGGALKTSYSKDK